MKNILILTALAALVLSSCSILPNRDLNSAQSRWQNARVTHYRYNVHVGCFCAFTARMPLTVEVANGVIKSMTYSDGTPVPHDQAEWFANYSSIDKLFTLTTEGLSKADDVKVEYDAKYGFPSTVYIDYIRQAADDELSLSVTNFQPLP